tara:strand:- start:1482 stop:2240 length:759 start_codon:yes stop_codon:yes gene_type:complete
MDLICEFCGKKYKRQKPFTHHKLLCEISKRDSPDFCREVENNTTRIVPSQRELYEIIINLNEKYERLEKNYDILKRYVYDKKRKIEIIDWLNQNYCLDVEFSELFLNIKLCVDDLNMVFENDYVNGVVEIILKFIEFCKTEVKNGEIPLRSFVQKDGVLYIYQDGEWKIMSSEIFDNFIRVINSQLVVLFKEWHIQNEKIMNEDKFNELYIKNLKCVMGGNFKDFERNIKIKNRVYRGIKQNFKNIMVYELS